jgi:tRNA modification GTPase
MKIIIRDDHTIVAQCTPQGAGAIALIRVSGKDSFEIVSDIAQLFSKKNFKTVPSHTIHYGLIVENNITIDAVLFFAMRGPKTFTGEDVVEISCHNNQLIVHKIIEALIKRGVRVADPGEFSKRAVMHNKLDLVQAEAINDIIAAKSDSALKQSLSALQGSFSALILSIEEKILEVMVYSEASFEFLDEEMNFSDAIKERLFSIMDLVEKSLHTFDKRRFLYEGVRVVLVGKTNVGKSSLFNALIDRDRAIVNDVAGTTRDTIEAVFFKNNLQLTFIDTAGIRETDNEIEQQGIDRSFDEAAQADIILLVVDSATMYHAHEIQEYQKLLAKYEEKIIIVQNKIDSATKPIDFLLDKSIIQVSAQHKKNIHYLFEEIERKVLSVIGKNDTPFVLNQRQFDLLLQFKNYLEPVIKRLHRSIDYELLSFHLKESLELLAEITGKTITEKAFDKVFQSFCVGK